MARGRIPDSDIAAIRERVRIEEVVGDYVALKPAGADSLKGLSPFKDEKTPSFHVRPNHGYFHCFSTGEGGDVFTFLMKMEHISFIEAVEQLADSIGYRITYEGGGVVQRERGSRLRLVQANAAAQEFYTAQLATAEAEPARRYLLERDFGRDAAESFGCGFAPHSWDALTKHLLSRGFEFKELEAAGLSKMGSRGGPIDRFRRRLVWPIRNLAGDVIGFGARKLFEDDTMGKYLNTSETMLYSKSQVLFGIDKAKKSIAAEHRAVVVEGYTDVMAMHAAGVTTAVAACGTAFGEGHMAMIRRLLLDESYFRGEVIYVFDGDEAGQKAAMKAFQGDQKFAGQQFVAIAPGGMDPCEIRQQSGDGAVRALVEGRVPIFEFAIKTMLKEYNLDIAEGRVAALRHTVPVVAEIREQALREEYARQLAGWVGWEPAEVLRRVRQDATARRKQAQRRPAQAPARARQNGGQGGFANGSAARFGGGAAGAGGVAARGSGAGERGAGERGVGERGAGRPRPSDPLLWAQREALKLALQEPVLAGPVFDSLPPECFTEPAYVEVHQAIHRAGGCTRSGGGAQWLGTVSEYVSGPMLKSLVTELGVEDVPVLKQADLPRFIEGVLARLQEVWVGKQITDLKSRLQRTSPLNDAENYRVLFGDLVALEEYRKGLRERAFASTE